MIFLLNLDQDTIERIKDCKRHGFPICLEEALSVIFKESAGQFIIERIITRIGLRERSVDSASEIWQIYDEVLQELAKALGDDVARVIEFESVRRMQSMKGCSGCPLYQREAWKRNVGH